MQPTEAPAQLVLPARTDVVLELDQTITTHGNAFKLGDTFALTVVQDVFKDGYIAIPRGSLASGRITWMTSRGSFGKSGKIEIAVDHVVANGRVVPLIGSYRQEGEGKSSETIGSIIAAGVLAGFAVSGKSATFDQGQRFVARTKDAMPFTGSRRIRPVEGAVAAPAAPVIARYEPPVPPPVTYGATVAKQSWGLVEVPMK